MTSDSGAGVTRYRTLRTRVRPRRSKSRDPGSGPGVGVLDQIDRVEGHPPRECERETDEQVAYELVGGAMRVTMPT